VALLPVVVSLLVFVPGSALVLASPLESLLESLDDFVLVFSADAGLSLRP
jgi:hypothetical protein